MANINISRMTAALPLSSLFVLLVQAIAGDDPAVLADVIDTAAHQKYASVSGLYWYTDLPAAQEAAREQGKPILSLRMLGRLDDDLSCAKSRLFRATLYANAELAGFLRENFVLYWSSERPVPVITIDFGDGRRVTTTATGNSAHYVMDADGRVLDVLPGLYSPDAFRSELEGSLALAAEVRAASVNDRAARVLAYHERESTEATQALAKLDAVRVRVFDATGSSVERGQRMTMTKALIEVRPLRSLGAALREKSYSADEVVLWATAGGTLYPRGGKPVLDERSRALVLKLHDGALPSALRGTDAQHDAVIAQLEQHIIADSALNQLVLRTQISREIVRRAGDPDFASLNTWIYDNVFHTPAADPWLGLLPRTSFTGLPGDGVVLP
jgi:hypothetical protein